MSNAAFPIPSSARVPLPLLFLAGAAFGVLLASLIVLCTHSRRTAKASHAMLGPAPIVATWQPNVITIRPAAPDPMFDMPPSVEPASLSAAAPAPAAAHRAVAAPKKAITRNVVRRHPAAKQPATGDLLTAAL